MERAREGAYQWGMAFAGRLDIRVYEWRVAMKKLSTALALAFALVLSFALVGCGGSKDYSENFTGTWKLTAMSGTTEDDIALMESFGMAMLLDLNEDKTLAFDMMGESMEGTWEAKSASECTLTIDGENATATLSGEELTLSSGDEEMTFKKISADEAAALRSTSGDQAASLLDGEGESDSAEAVDADFAPVTVADDSLVTLEIVGKKTDYWGDSGYVANITNNSDKAIYVTVPFDQSSVNDVMVDFWGSQTVQPGKKATDVFFYADSEDVASLDELANVDIVFEVWDNDTMDTLGSYPVILS